MQKTSINGGVAYYHQTLSTEGIEHGDRIYFVEYLEKIKTVPMITVPQTSLEDEQEEMDIKAAIEASMKGIEQQNQENQDLKTPEFSNQRNYQQNQLLATCEEAVAEEDLILQTQQINTPSTVPSTPEKRQAYLQQQQSQQINQSHLQQIIMQRDEQRIQEMKIMIQKVVDKKKHDIMFRNPLFVIQALNKLELEVKNYSLNENQMQSTESLFKKNQIEEQMTQQQERHHQ